MSSTQWAAIALILFVVGVGIGYMAAPKGAAPAQCPPCECPPCQPQAAPQYKAAFIYIGPIGDYGWTHEHEMARRAVQEMFPWLNTTYIESVPPDQAEGKMEELISEGYNIIFTTSFDYMDPTINEAKKHSDVFFFHCSGYKRWKNSGTYFADFYQLYYLNGLMAGALTRTGKVGYVAAFTIPEVVRHINAFAIGVHEVNPDAVVLVREIGAWYNPDLAADAAESLISEGVDVLAFTEDSPTVLQVAQQHHDRGERVLAFGHYSPMKQYGPDVCVSGQIAHWDRILEDILAKIYSGVYTTQNLENVDYWWKLKEGAVELGCADNEPINPIFIDELRQVHVNETVLLPNGTVLENPDVYKLVMARMIQMGVVWHPDTGTYTFTNDECFDPFTGPLYDNQGHLMAPEGQRLGHDALWTMQWWYQNVQGPPLGGG